MRPAPGGSRTAATTIREDLVTRTVLHAACAFCLTVWMATAAAAAQLELKVVQGSEASLLANATLILGEKEAILVDPPFTRADGLRLAAAVLDTGRTLSAILITHDHPDHFFSVDALTDEFPGVKVYAAPQVVEDIWKSYPIKLKRWGPMLGENGPRHPVAVTPLAGNELTLEGQAIQVLGPMQGDHAHATAVYIPSLQALVCGDLCFNKIHLWLGEHTHAQYDLWLASLDKLAALKPRIVVAGHRLAGLPDDASALDFTRRYLVAFKAAAASSKSSAELIDKIHKEFPDTQDVLNGFILGNSAKVAVGEMPPWDE